MPAPIPRWSRRHQVAGARRGAVTVACASCCGIVQYRLRALVRETTRRCSSTRGRCRAPVLGSPEVRERLGSCSGWHAGQQRERRDPRRDRGGERLAEERPERHVLPGLDVAGAPVVDEHDAEHVVGERAGLDARAPALHADDEAELELDVEPLRRAEGGRRAVWPCGRHDVGAAHDDGAGAAVVADRQVAPVGQQRLGVGPEQPAEVRGVLDRRVEVDVVGDLERQARLTRDLRAVEVLERVLPGAAAERHERVEARLPEVLAVLGEVDHAVALAPADAALDDPEAADHRIPIARNSSTGSKNEQLPIEWKRSRRTAAARRARPRGRPSETSRRRGRSRPRRARPPRRRTHRPRAGSGTRDRARREPRGAGPAVALNTSPRSRQPRTNAASSADGDARRSEPWRAARRRRSRRAAVPRRRPRRRTRPGRRASRRPRRADRREPRRASAATTESARPSPISPRPRPGRRSERASRRVGSSCARRSSASASGNAIEAGGNSGA